MIKVTLSYQTLVREVRIKEESMVNRFPGDEFSVVRSAERMDEMGATGAIQS